MENLNGQQMLASTFTGKHILVLAGAGTGKTRTIIARAKHLIQSGVNPKRILILSFTRKSAYEIVERIAMEMPENKSEGLSGSTFHSWCMSIIKNHPQVFPQANFTLLDDDDQESCFRLLCGRNWKYKGVRDKNIKPEHIKEVYSYMANARCSLSDAIRMKIYDNAPGNLDVSKENDVLKGVITMYIDFKKKRKYIDYDDILLIVSQYLKRNEKLRKHVAGMYDHILIDEMQDTNPLQYELLSSFYNDCHLFCVGDDAQSIYGFRGADFKTIHNFPEIVPETEVCKLTLNYRSTQEILDLSNWVLSQSPLDYDKYLIAARGHGNKPLFKHWGEEWEEANDIALSIQKDFCEKGKKWNDSLVLSRSAWGLRKIEGAFIKFKIPYIIYGGQSLMSSRHVRDVVSPMRIVSNYLDELAWSRYLQLWNNIGPVTAAEIIGKTVAAESLAESMTALEEIVARKNFRKEVVTTLRRISEKQSDPSEAIGAAIAEMFDRLKEIYKDEWDWRKDDFPILQEVAKKSGSIGEFVAEYILDPKLDTTLKEAGKKDDVVVMSTIHSAKGLEADSVYLVNASTHSYPTKRAILNGEDAIEEERRCLYVALTRARDNLTVYRDIHSIHVASEEDRYYFFHDLPGTLYDVENIAANYFAPDDSDFGSIIDEDIYSDFDLG